MDNREKPHISVTDVRIDDIYANILRSFEEDKVYLSPTLSLIELSTIVGTNTTYLSRIVNQQWGYNVRYLINSYRVRYAEQLLLDGEHSMKEVMRKSGFASRSAFYSAFQRIVGVSPLNYLIMKKGGERTEQVKMNL